MKYIAVRYTIKQQSGMSSVERGICWKALNSGSWTGDRINGVPHCLNISTEGLAVWRYLE